MMVVLLFDRNEERGKELKVPHHARATSVRDGNMPGVTAACLIPDSLFRVSSFIGTTLFYLELSSSRIYRLSYSVRRRARV